MVLANNFNKTNMNNRIFIQIAAFRDPELKSTIRDCIVKADKPYNLVFAIAWQHAKKKESDPEGTEDDAWDELDEFKQYPYNHDWVAEYHCPNDKDHGYSDGKIPTPMIMPSLMPSVTSVKIIDIPYLESKGCCWARNEIQKLYDGEGYTLQLDSHMRFVKGWDTMLIGMNKQLKELGYPKPLLTSYAPGYIPAQNIVPENVLTDYEVKKEYLKAEETPSGRLLEPLWLPLNRFIPEGTIFYSPSVIPGWQEMTQPLPARFYSAHFAFADGIFCKEVPHDPLFLFHGEECSISVRAYTHGYDLFAPHRHVCFHEYTRIGRIKYWDKNSNYGRMNDACHKRNRILFGMDGENPNQIDFGIYGFGKERTLHDYEKYAGISFSKRSIQQYTKDNKFPPNPPIKDEEWDASLQYIFSHYIDIEHHLVPHKDYDLWAVDFRDADNEVICREDALPNEIRMLQADPERIKMWRSFKTTVKPVAWTVWPRRLVNGVEIWVGDKPIRGELPAC